jgi:hypothetical protein
VSGTLVVTACDDNHFDLVSDLIQSLNHVRDGTFHTAYINIDDGPRCRALRDSVDVYETASLSPSGNAIHGFKVSAMRLKSRLPSLFPGFETYVWLDGDTWVQNVKGIANAVRAAQKADVAIHPELDPHYFQNQFPQEYTILNYRVLYPDADPSRAKYAMFNTGVFAARTDSKLWGLWDEQLAAIRERHLRGEYIYFTDQIPLHFLIVTGKIAIYPLRSVDNWLLWFVKPSLNVKRKKIVVPTEPHEEINILHLAGPTKHQQYAFGETGLMSTFRYSDVKRYFSGS